MSGYHEPVLLQPTITTLNPNPGETIIDATAGHGGHALALAKHLGQQGKMLLLDQDEEALTLAQANLASVNCRIIPVVGNFRDLEASALKVGIKSAEVILFDLGFNSGQLESGRGFSFLKDEPLMMTFKSAPGEEDVTAFDVVNDWSEENLATIIFGFGEERFAKRIARAIAEARAKETISTSGQLTTIITRAIPVWARSGRRHPATKTFQAIRMAVNQELTSIQAALPQAWNLLTSGGRLGVISFHSLEARIVKNYFRDRLRQKEAISLTPKPIKPSREEILANPRSRSAELRVIKKL